MMAFNTELEARIIHVLGRLPAQIKIKRDQLTTFRKHYAAILQFRNQRK